MPARTPRVLASPTRRISNRPDQATARRARNRKPIINIAGDAQAPMLDAHSVLLEVFIIRSHVAHRLYELDVKIWQVHIGDFDLYFLPIRQIELVLGHLRRWKPHHVLVLTDRLVDVPDDNPDVTERCRPNLRWALRPGGARGCYYQRKNQHESHVGHGASSSISPSVDHVAMYVTPQRVGSI